MLSLTVRLIIPKMLIGKYICCAMIGIKIHHNTTNSPQYDTFCLGINRRLQSK